MIDDWLVNYKKRTSSSIKSQLQTTVTTIKKWTDLPLHCLHALVCPENDPGLILIIWSDLTSNSADYLVAFGTSATGASAGAPAVVAINVCTDSRKLVGNCSVVKSREDRFSKNLSTFPRFPLRSAIKPREDDEEDEAGWWSMMMILLFFNDDEWWWCNGNDDVMIWLEEEKEMIQQRNNSQLMH